jgi:2-succinyl-5-enolpyruvyl-6-hydroxy-3-cyclohexene-1-carboxylate synthase
VLDPDAPHRVAAAVWNAVRADDLLVLGSSNPVRDVDLLARAAPHRVLANRGLAGIDGMVSTAVGAALAHGSSGGGPAWALMGDLTFLHGANGLLIGPDEPRADLTIVVVSDDGGSIFSTLEQGGPEHAAAFERVFGTPTRTHLDRLCAAHDVPHERVAPAELPLALRARPTGLRVIEVPVRRDDRRAVEARISAAVRDALD